MVWVTASPLGSKGGGRARRAHNLFREATHERRTCCAERPTTPKDPGLGRPLISDSQVPVFSRGRPAPHQGSVQAAPRRSAGSSAASCPPKRREPAIIAAAPVRPAHVAVPPTQKAASIITPLADATQLR